jgi:hypothetical protein
MSRGPGVALAFAVLALAEMTWIGCASQEDDHDGGTVPTDAITSDGADGPLADARLGDAGCASITTPENCGSCGHACPGLGQPAAEVGCASSACTFACKGEFYDVNNNAADGCEVADSPMGNHTPNAATSLGSLPCDDADSHVNVSGTLPNDTRGQRVPSVAGFNVSTGAAPDLFVIQATGGSCVDDIAMTVAVSGSTTPTCFMLKVNTVVGQYQCQTNSSGTCSVNQGLGSYHDNTAVLITVDRTCSAPPERPTYTVKGHL